MIWKVYNKNAANLLVTILKPLMINVTFYLMIILLLPLLGLLNKTETNLIVLILLLLILLLVHLVLVKVFYGLDAKKYHMTVLCIVMIIM